MLCFVFVSSCVCFLASARAFACCPRRLAFVVLPNVPIRRVLVRRLCKTHHIIANSMSATYAGDERCFENRLSDYGFPERLQEHLFAGVHAVHTRLNNIDPDTRRRGSIYLGVAGCGMFYHRLGEALASGSVTPAALGLPGHSAAFDRAMALIKEGERLTNRNRISFLEGLPGVFALRYATAAALGQSAEASDAVARLAGYAKQVSAEPPTECEVLYGRCGYLHACLFARSAAAAAGVAPPASVVPDATLRAIAQQVLQQGVEFVETHPQLANVGLMYTWHDSPYLGGAHGLAGILLTLLQVDSELGGSLLGADADAARRVKQAVQALVQIQNEAGNFPSSLGKERDRLVQWCHGAPGVIPLLAAAIGHPGLFTEQERAGLRESLGRAADAVWRRGLLRKGLGLCHGVAGNGYALLTAARALGDPRRLRQAAAFAAWGVQHLEQLEGTPDHPHSLFEGLAGFGVFCLDCMLETRGVGGAYFPGCELPGGAPAAGAARPLA